MFCFSCQTLLTAKCDDGSFVYALPHNQKDKRARYNPYDLQVVSANSARTCPVFWTASASNVTMVFKALKIPFYFIIPDMIDLIQTGSVYHFICDHHALEYHDVLSQYQNGHMGQHF